MEITILCSSADHPINKCLYEWISSYSTSHSVNLVRRADDANGGDILFLVSCHEIIKSDVRSRYRYCLVLHASDLPQGRGMSPHIWQVVEGKNELVLSLLSADEQLDSGAVWKKIPIILNGSELFDEINDKVFAAEIDAMSWAVAHINDAHSFPQHGEPSYYRRRTPDDCQIDPYLSIESQFDLLRTADPDRYPAFFFLRGCKYKIRLEKVNDGEE